MIKAGVAVIKSGSSMRWWVGERSTHNKHPVYCEHFGNVLLKVTLTDELRIEQFLIGPLCYDLMCLI